MAPRPPLPALSRALTVEALRAQDRPARGEVTQPQSTLGNLLCVGPRPLAGVWGDESAFPAMCEVKGTGLGKARMGRQKRDPVTSLGPPQPGRRLPFVIRWVLLGAFSSPRCCEVAEKSSRCQKLPSKRTPIPITPSPSWTICSQPLLLNGKRMPGVSK